ncbi:hypothetical protein [Vibrio owensii]|uniref:hypothetical protein n=1 Tax=Vibrio owensii TaxID=696485 RepID=UPI0040676643
MNTRTIHIHMEVKSLLEKSDKELKELVTHPEGIAAARNELNEMLENGELYLVIDSNCDNRKPDGSCAGHPLPDSQ